LHVAATVEDRVTRLLENWRAGELLKRKYRLD